MSRRPRWSVVLVMVLLVVASNVATLVFARTWSRAPELAVRTALGAAAHPRRRPVVLGDAAARIDRRGHRAWPVRTRSLRYIKSRSKAGRSTSPSSRIRASSLFVVVLTLLVSAVSGLLPALRVTRHDLRNTLHGGRGFAFGGFGKAGALLLVVEIALSVALLNGAVTMARAFNAYYDDIPALPKNQILTAHLGRIPIAELRDRVVAAARELPGVIAAGAGQQLPRLYPPPRPTAVEPIGDEPAMAPQPAPGHAVGHGFLEAIGARAVSGRLFDATDFVEGAAPGGDRQRAVRAASFSAAATRLAAGSASTVSARRTRRASRTAEQPWREIVGVVPDLGLSVGDPALAAGFYLPVRDEMLWFLAIRTTSDPLTLAPRCARRSPTSIPICSSKRFARSRHAGQEERVFLSGVATALTAMGGMALMLSIVGIYALLSFMVTRRTREIGIRVALGAAELAGVAIDHRRRRAVSRDRRRAWHRAGRSCSCSCDR